MAPPGRVVDVQHLLDEGRALHAQGRLKDAFARYQSALAAAPEHPDALHLVGVAYLGLGRADFGTAFLRRAIARKPDDADFRVNLANALARQGQAAEAAAEMDRACALRPDDAEAHAGLAALRDTLEQPAEAEAAYAAALEIDPGRADWHEALARLRYRRWALPEAMASAELARALSDAVRMRLNMGFALPGPALPRPAPAGLLNSSPLLDAAALEDACAERDLLVIDDFLPDPMAVREEALRLCEHHGTFQQGVNFPGVQTPPQPCGETMQRIASLLGRPLKWDSPDTGALRVSLAGDEARADVHVDNPTLPHIYGSVLHLTLPGHCSGGTSFYRHRGSGWARRPDAAALRAAGYASFLDFQKRNLPPNKRQPFAEWQRQRNATWELLFEVPTRFNRLVVFRSDFFHAISGLYGDSLASGRLVQLFHFESQQFQ